MPVGFFCLLLTNQSKTLKYAILSKLHPPVPRNVYLGKKYVHSSEYPLFPSRVFLSPPIPGAQMCFFGSNSSSRASSASACTSVLKD